VHRVRERLGAAPETRGPLAGTRTSSLLIHAACAALRSLARHEFAAFARKQKPRHSGVSAITTADAQFAAHLKIEKPRRGAGVSMCVGALRPTYGENQ
jgi:hypothetical protein